MSYFTCAIYDGKGTAPPALNPFTLAEYEGTCATKDARSRCVLPKAPADLPGTCKIEAAQGGVAFAMTPECMRDLRHRPTVGSWPRDATADARFEEAELCFTRTQGEFQTFCGKGEVVRTQDVAARVGANCEKCCATVLKQQAAGAATKPKPDAAAHAKPTDASHSAPSHVEPPHADAARRAPDVQHAPRPHFPFLH
jgi:hypothetical protein